MELTDYRGLLVLPVIKGHKEQLVHKALPVQMVLTGYKALPARKVFKDPQA